MEETVNVNFSLNIEKSISWTYFCPQNLLKIYLSVSLSLLHNNKDLDHTNWLQMTAVLAAFLVRKCTNLDGGGSPNHPRSSIISVSSISQTSYLPYTTPWLRLIFTRKGGARRKSLYLLFPIWGTFTATGLNDVNIWETSKLLCLQRQSVFS